MPKPRNGPLTVKQKRFIEEYLVDLNGAAAARRAGYNTKGSKQAALKLLMTPVVSDEIQRRMEELRKKCEIDAEYVLKNLREVSERCMQSRPVVNKKGEPVMTETPDGEIVPAYTFDSSGANRSLHLIGLHIGMFVERKEIGKPGEFDELSDEELDDINRQADAEASRRSEGDQEGPVFIPPVH